MQNIEVKAENFVKELFKEKLPAWAVYHTFDHTLETVQTAREIGQASDVDRNEIEILSIAAWFHDTGYLFGADNHEEKSIEIAEEFLKSENCSRDLLVGASNCIKATKIIVTPYTLLECIIRDADLVSLGKPDYFATNNRLKKEFELRENITIKESDWLKRSEKFLSSHRYFTGYAKMKYNDQLELNLKELQKALQRIPQ